MSPIPAFDGRGLLPAFEGSDETTANRSPYDATMAEVVARFGGSDERRVLIRGLLDYRGLLLRLGYTDGIQFVDGSFVENVEAREGRPPRDIDVFSFLVRPAKYRLDPALWASAGFAEWAQEVVDRPRDMARFNLDTYAVAADEHDGLRIILTTIYWTVFSLTDGSRMIGRVSYVFR
jgi:hypothetical protein